MLTSLEKLYLDYKSCRAHTGTSLNNVSKKASGWKYHYYQDVQEGDGVTCILVVNYGNEAKLIKGMKALGLVGKKTKEPFISMKKCLRRWVDMELGAGCLNSLDKLDANLSHKDNCFVLLHPELKDSGYDKISVKKRPRQDGGKCTGSNKRKKTVRSNCMIKIFENLSLSSLLGGNTILSGDISTSIKGLKCSDEGSGLHYIYDWDVGTGGSLLIRGSDGKIDSLLRGLSIVAGIRAASGCIKSIQGTICKQRCRTSYDRKNNSLKIYEDTRNPEHFRCHPLLCGSRKLGPSQARGNVVATKTGGVKISTLGQGASSTVSPRVESSGINPGNGYSIPLLCPVAASNNSSYAIPKPTIPVIPLTVPRYPVAPSILNSVDPFVFNSLKFLNESNKIKQKSRPSHCMAKIFDNLCQSSLLAGNPILSGDIKTSIKRFKCSDKASGLHYIYDWDFGKGGSLNIRGGGTLDSLLAGLSMVAKINSSKKQIKNIQATIFRRGYRSKYNSHDHSLTILENADDPLSLPCHPLVYSQPGLFPSQALGNVVATKTGGVKTSASDNSDSAPLSPRVESSINLGSGDSTPLSCSGSSANCSGVAMSQLNTPVIPPAGFGHLGNYDVPSINSPFGVFTDPNATSSASGCGETSHAVCRNQGGYNKFGNLGDGHVLQHSGEISPTNMGDGNDNKIDTASSLICIKPVPLPADLEKSSSSSGVGVIRDPIIPSIDPWQQGSSAGGPSGNNSAVSSDSARLPPADSNLKSEVVQQAQDELHEDPSLKYFLSMFTDQDERIINGSAVEGGQNSLFECTSTSS